MENPLFNCGSGNGEERGGVPKGEKKLAPAKEGGGHYEKKTFPRRGKNCPTFWGATAMKK